MLNPSIQDDLNKVRSQQISDTYTLGYVRIPSDGDDPFFLSGGCRIEVPEAETKGLQIVRVREVNKNKFGPNLARATPLETGTLLNQSTETRTGVRYRPADGPWMVLDRGPIERDILSRLHGVADSEGSFDVVLPGYDPKAALPIAIECLLQSTGDADVALFTPGSSIHWGNKGDVREEYSRYGLSADVGLVDDAVPMPRVFPDAYISGSQIVGANPGDTRLVLSKRRDELEPLSEDAVIILNFLARTFQGFPDVKDGFRDQLEDRTVITLWSPFTKQEREGIPAYAPPDSFNGSHIQPGRSVMSDVTGDAELASTKATSNSQAMFIPEADMDDPILPPPPTTTDLPGFILGGSPKVVPVGTENIQERFEELWSESGSLRDEGLTVQANRVFSALMFFERLPVPTSDFDSWIHSRLDEGEVYLPDTSEDHLDSLETSEHEEVSLLHARKTLEGIHAELTDRSPMLEALVEEIIEASDDGESTAIFVQGKTSGKILRSTLEYRSEIHDEGLEGFYRVFNSDSVRDMKAYDRLVFCGVQRPERAGFYSHPRVGEALVLTYTQWSEGLVGRHSESYLETLHAAIGEIEGVQPPAAESEDGPAEPGEDQGSDDGLDGASEEDDLSSNDARRIKDIVELAPTKNAELMEEWGFDSGSDLHQYMSTHLDPYYTRNDEGLIVPTEEAQQRVE